MRCGSGGACVVAPGVHVLGVGLWDQALVGVVLQGRVDEAVSGGSGHFLIESCLCRFNQREFSYRYADQDGASKSLGLQANAKD